MAKKKNVFTIVGNPYEAYAIKDEDGINPNLVSTDKKSLKDMLEKGETLVKVLVVEV